MTERIFTRQELVEAIQRAATRHAARMDRLEPAEVVAIAAEVGVPEEDIRHVIEGMSAREFPERVSVRGVTAVTTRGTLCIDTRMVGPRLPLLLRLVAWVGYMLVIDRMSSAASPSPVLPWVFGAFWVIAIVWPIQTVWQMMLKTTITVEGGTLRLVSRRPWWQQEVTGALNDIRIGDVDVDSVKGIPIAPVRFLPITLDGTVVEAMKGLSESELRFVRTLLKDRQATHT